MLTPTDLQRQTLRYIMGEGLITHLGLDYYGGE
jgi:hypothetical protein